jgi:hypothetical protein
MPTRAQFSRRELLTTDIEKQKRLHAIHLPLAAAIQLVFDDVEQLAVKTLHQIQTIEILPV